MHSVVFTLGKSVRITVEVVSTNWRDDYLTKLGEYEVLGIQEYWIVDYAALGGRRFMFAQVAVERHQLKLIVYNPVTEEIVRWIN